MHHRDEPYLHARYRVAPYMGIFPLDSCGVDPWDIYNRINEYSRRSLTHQTDILKGILGIFRTFERGKNSMRHLYGIPFPQMAKSSPNESTYETNSKRKMPLFSESLRWTLKEPSERREGFPSWSWTGWFGEIEWPAEYTGAAFPHRTPRRIERPRDPKVNENAIQVAVELLSGDTINWETFQARYPELLTFSELSGIIHLEAYTTPAAYLNEHGGSKMNLRLHCENGQFTTLLVERTTKHEFELHHPFLAIHFYRTVSEDQGKGYQNTPKRKTVTVKQHLLVIRDIGSHWERVAIGTYVIDPRKKLDCKWECLQLG